MSTLYLCGAGNSEGVRLAVRVNEQRRRWDRIVLLDDAPALHGQSILDVRIEGPFALLERADPSTDEVANLVSRTTAKRTAARVKIESFGLPFAALIHPSIDLLGVRLEGDVTLYPGAMVCSLASMDAGSVAFMGAIVGHGSQLGRGCVVAPNAVINARVRLAEGVYVGTSATILPDVRIGRGATIAAASVVMRHVPEGATVMGNPAKALPSFKQQPARRDSEHRTNADRHQRERQVRHG